MEVMLNLVDTLMEVGVHKNWQSDSDEDPQPETIDPLNDLRKDKDSKVIRIRSYLLTNLNWKFLSIFL